MTNLVFHERNQGGNDEGYTGGTGLGIEVGWQLVAERLSGAGGVDD